MDSAAISLRSRFLMSRTDRPSHDQSTSSGADSRERYQHPLHTKPFWRIWIACGKVTGRTTQWQRSCTLFKMPGRPPQYSSAIQMQVSEYRTMLVINDRVAYAASHHAERRNWCWGMYWLTRTASAEITSPF